MVATKTLFFILSAMNIVWTFGSPIPPRLVKRNAVPSPDNQDSGDLGTPGNLDYAGDSSGHVADRNRNLTCAFKPYISAFVADVDKAVNDAFDHYWIQKEVVVRNCLFEDELCERQGAENSGRTYSPVNPDSFVQNPTNTQITESLNKVVEGIYAAGHLLSNATHLEETFTCRKPPTFEYGCLTNEAYGICKECVSQPCPQEEHTIACNVIEKINYITPPLRNLRYKIEEMMLDQGMTKNVDDNLDVKPIPACESVTCECDVSRYSVEAMAQTRKHALAVAALMDTICP